MLKDKYTTVEKVIDEKASGVADAKKRAQLLQQEAKQLLLKASDKLQLLKGDVSKVLASGRIMACSPPVAH